MFNEIIYIEYEKPSPLAIHLFYEANKYGDIDDIYLARIKNSEEDLENAIDEYSNSLTTENSNEYSNGDDEWSYDNDYISDVIDEIKEKVLELEPKEIFNYFYHNIEEHYNRYGDILMECLKRTEDYKD